MKFDVHAINYHSNKIISTFLHYYRQANRIIIYGNEFSNDSMELIKTVNREFIILDTEHTLVNEINTNLKNSIGIDFVIVQDIEDFLYFPQHPSNIAVALTEYKIQEITCAVGIGYNVVYSEDDWNFCVGQIVEI